MLVLARDENQRIAQFVGNENGEPIAFLGWITMQRGVNRTRIGFQDFPDSFMFKREEILTDRERQLTLAHKCA